MTALIKRPLARFVIAGGVNTLFGFAVYASAIFFGTTVWAALLIANVAGVLFNFFSAGMFVFRASLQNRFGKFIAVYLAVYLINLVLIRALGHVIASPVWSQAVLTLPMAAVSFTLMRRFVFASGLASVAQEPP